MVADAGMLSAANLLALEEAGFRFIVGSKTSKAPYDLADHFERHGNAFSDGQTIETTRTMGTGKDARDRRVVYQYSFKRYQHDNQAINAMIERAEAVAAGTRPLKKDRFVKITDADTGVDWDLVERARYLAGLKGYVTNIDADAMDGEQVVTAYHDLYQVERSFRMAKSDLAARPIFHRHPRQHRGPPDHRVRRARGLPRSPSPHRTVASTRSSRPCGRCAPPPSPSAPSRSPPHRASRTRRNAILDDLAQGGH